MKKKMMVVLALALTFIMAVAPMTAFAAASTTNTETRTAFNGNTATVENFVRDFSTNYEVAYEAVSGNLVYENNLTAETIARPTNGALNLAAASFTTATRDTTVRVAANGGIVIVDNTVTIYHFGGENARIEVAIPSGSRYSVPESWDCGGAVGATAAAVEAAFLLSKDTGFLTSIHVEIHGNGKLLFRANLVAPGEQPELPSIGDEEEAEEPEVEAPPAEVTSEEEDTEAETAETNEVEVAPPGNAGPDEDLDVCMECEKLPCICDVDNETAEVDETPATPAWTAPSVPAMPEDDAGWTNFLNLYNVDSGISGHITVRTLRGNLAYQRHLNARHLEGNQSLVHSDVIWEVSDGTEITVPIYNILVATNGRLVANHYGTDGRASHVIRVTLPVGTRYAIIPSNDMAGANGMMASIVEAMWTLANYGGGLPWIDGTIYGNGQAVGTISAVPPRPPVEEVAEATEAADAA